MKFNVIKRGVAAILAASLLLTDTAIVQASQKDDGYEQYAETISENTTDLRGKEEREVLREWETQISENDIGAALSQAEEGRDTISENIMESASSDPAEVIATISSNDYPQEELSLRPENFIVLSEEEKQQKEDLEEQLPAISLLEEGRDYVKGEVLVIAETEEKATEYAKAFGGELQDYFAPIAVIRLPEETEGGITVQEIVVASANEEINLPAAWPNYYHYPDGTEDPFLTESHQGYQWHHLAIGSKKAWEAGYLGAGIKVAVLDSGFDPTTTDLSVDTKVVSEALGTEDVYGHGTHVAGIIGAQYNNGTGGAGIAPESEIISIKVINDSGAAESADIIRGIQLAMEANADIINLSLGSGAYSEAEQVVVSQAYEKGIAVICSAGNSNSTAPHYPAGYQGAIGVAALDKNNHKAGFSNSGAYIRYSAPGVDIVSTHLDGYYDSISGTSQAAPIVSGIAAVLLASGTVEGEGPDRLHHLLTLMDQSCEKVTGTGLGKGSISLVKALKLNPVSAAPREPEFSVAAGTYQKEELKVSITSAPGAELYYTLDGKNITYKNGMVSEGAQKYEPGTEISIQGKSVITLKAMAVNPENDLASKVVTAKYTLKPIASDLVIESKGGNNIVSVGKSLELTARLIPDYTVDKKVQWAVKESNSFVTVKNGKVTVKKGAAPGVYTIVATAKAADGSFTGAEDTYEIQVIENDNPITKVVLEQKSPVVNAGEDIALAVTIEKKDKTAAGVGDLLWYSEDNTIARVAATQEGTLKLVGNKAGKVKIYAVASDGHGKKFTFTVTVKQPIEQITLTGYDTLAIGKSITLKAELNPEKVTDSKINWSIQPETSKVKISNKGKVTAAKGAEPGTYKITATSSDGKVVSNEFSLQVVANPIKKLQLDTSTLQLFRKENSFGSITSSTIFVTTQEGNGEEWEVQSSNENLLKVEKTTGGFIATATGKGTGTVVVTVTTTDGSNLKKTCKVKIDNPITGLHLAPEKGRASVIAKGKKLKLTPVFETAYGNISTSAKKLVWTSSNTSAVRVDKKGNVTAVKSSGTSIIMARSQDGSNVVAEFQVSTCGVTGKVHLMDPDTGDYEKSTIKMSLSGEKVYIVDHSYYVNWLGYGDPGSWEFEYKVDKEGLGVVVRWQKIPLKSGALVDVPIVYMVGNRRGTYKLTITSTDGSSAKKTFTIKVE